MSAWPRAAPARATSSTRPSGPRRTCVSASPSREAGEQGLRRLQLATARLSELEALSASGRTLGLAAAPSAVGPSALGRPLAAGASRSDVLAVLDDMDDDVRDGFALMLDAYRSDGDKASLEVVRGWSVEQAARLRALLPRLSPALQLRGEGSLALVREVEGEVVRLLALPSAGAPTGGAPPPASSDLPDGPSASAGPSGVPDAGFVPSAPPSPGPTQPGTGPRPTSPVDGEDAPLSQPTARDDAPSPPAPPPPPAAPRRAPSPDPLPSVVVPGVVLPSAGLPTVDLPAPSLPSLPSLPDLPDLPGDGLTRTR